MKRIGLLIAFFALLFIVLPSFTTAQDEKKKDPDKAEKKAEKKDEAKKDDPKKDDPKKDDPKKTDDPEKKKDKDEPKKEKINYGNKFVTKILSANGASGREFTVEIKEVDPKKVTDAQTWSAQRMQQMSQQLAQATQQYNTGMASKDFKARITAQQNYAKAQATYQNDVYKFQVELAKKDVYSTKPWDVRAHDEAKVRAMTPPVEFDDLGFEKKWTKKELEERRDKTGLPGFAVNSIKSNRASTWKSTWPRSRRPQRTRTSRKRRRGPTTIPCPPRRKLALNS
jgi:hypothetical protein